MRMSKNNHRDEQKLQYERKLIPYAMRKYLRSLLSNRCRPTYVTFHWESAGAHYILQTRRPKTEAQRTLRLPHPLTRKREIKSTADGGRPREKEKMCEGESKTKNREDGRACRQTTGKFK